MKLVGDILYTGSADSTVRSWNVKVGACLVTYRGHSSFIHNIEVQNEILFTISHDTTICMWKAKQEFSKPEPRLRSRSGGSIIEFYNYNTLAKGAARNEKNFADNAVESKYRTRKYSVGA